MKQRDNAVDFFRGFAVIWIIFIHTCFHSGNIYVPTWLQSFSLMIDVPLFIFISGMVVNFNQNFFKTIKGLVKIWTKWLVFLIIYFMIFAVLNFHGLTLDEMVKSLFFNTSNATLEIVLSSLWFVPMFIVVSIAGNIIILLYNRCFKDISYFKDVLLFIFMLSGMSMYSNATFFSISPLYMIYLFIYLLGYYLYHFKFKSTQTFIMTMVLYGIVLVTMLLFREPGFLSMQQAKFAPDIIYFIYSMFSILVVTYLKDRINVKDKNILCFIGKNALLFYFCQGIGASLIFYLYPVIANLSGIIKLGIMFAANFLITCILFIILYFIINKIIPKINFNIQVFDRK